MKRLKVLLMMIILIVIAPMAVQAANSTDIGVSYGGHVENYGNMPKPEGTMIAGPDAIGTRGQGLRVEGFWIELTGDVPEGASINLSGSCSERRLDGPGIEWRFCRNSR